MADGTGGGSRRNPASDLGGILTGTGLRKYLEACRKDDMAAYDALHEAAATLKAGILRAGGGRKLAMGVDVRIAARRITKPILHAAELHLAAAKAHGTAWSVYMQTLGAPMPDKVSAKTFDPTK